MAIRASLKLYYRFDITRAAVPLFGLGPNLTENNGPLTYDSQGVLLNAASSQYLSTSNVSWWNQSQGVWYVVASHQDPSTTSNDIQFQIDDGTSTNRHLIFYDGDPTGTSRFFIANSGTQFDVTASGSRWAENAEHHSAFYYEANSAKAAWDGTLGSEDTSVSLPSGLNRLLIGNSTSSEFWDGYIKEVRYYNVKDPEGNGDPDTFLQNLTNGLVFENADVWGAQNSFHIPFYRKQRR